MTNFEKIKAMSVEEMAEHLDKTSCDYCCFQKQPCDYYLYGDEICKKSIKQWLEREAEEDG